MKTPEAGTTNVRYSEVRTAASQILAGKELGYIYAFPDKRLYAPVADPLAFIQEAWSSYEGEIGIYVHTPFCTPKPPTPEAAQLLKDHGNKADGRDHLCGYCNLFTVVAPGVPNWFAQNVTREVNLYRPLFEGKAMQPRSMYFGGGTPSLMDIENISTIVTAIEDIFGRVPDDKERAIECAPDSVDYDKLSALRQIGFNRVSIGVQSFDESVLHYTGRDYDAQRGHDAIANALKVGFENVNADLIIGLPTSTEETFFEDLRIMRTLGPHTITLYQDMTRPVTRFGKMAELGILPEVSQQDIYNWTEIADAQLRSDGYTRQTLTCWARGNSGYQQGDDIYERVPIIGFGPGARSYSPNAHYSTEYTVGTRLINYLISRWRQNIEEGKFPDITGSVLSDDLKDRADIIFGLMSVNGLSVQKVIARFSPELAALKDMGLVTEQEGVWRYTQTGKAYSGALSRIFFGKEIEDQLRTYEHR